MRDAVLRASSRSHGSDILKEAPDVDFYVEWSSVVEAPTYWGTRASEVRRSRKSAAPSRTAPQTRVDETGTSSIWITKAGMRGEYPEEGSWEDVQGEIYKQQGMVRRAHLFELARRLSDGLDVADLVEPLENESADA